MAADLLRGTVVAADGGFALNLGGSVAPAAWMGGYLPRVGDTVLVLRGDDGTLAVLGLASTAQRPITGTVAGAASGGLVPVTVSVGPSPLQCRFVGTAPATGTLVRLDWQSSEPWIWPNAAAVVPTPDTPEPDPTPAPPPPPPPARSGTDTFPVIDSGSYRPGYGRWDNGRVLQWRYGSESESRGAWFLGVAPTQLRGRTITGFRFWPGPRARVGSYNSTLTAHFYLISNPSRPGGDASRIAGPHDVAIGPGADPEITLPPAWGQTLADNGGGLAITGSPYLGFDASGTRAAFLDWSR